MKFRLKNRKLKNFEREIIRQAGDLVSLRRRSNLFVTGELANRVFMVEKGWLGIYRDNPKGESIWVGDIRGPGELLGVAEVLSGEYYSYCAHGVTDAMVSVLSRDAFVELLDTEPFLAVKLFKTRAFTT